MPCAYKRLICFLLSTLVLLSVPVFSLNKEGTQSKENRPSEWAETEIYASIEEGLVPEGLQAHYRENITRSQYVLLALRVFDLSDKVFIYNEAEPFSDILSHDQEADIKKAFNAGIIKGDGKGHFFPDKEITREEIASLIVNLLMQISPERNYKSKQDSEYADTTEISDWAKTYIDYCFENKLINGIGNDERGKAIMAPKGRATIEQSIALLYRLAKKEGIKRKSSFGTIKLSPDNEEVDASVIDRFVSTFGESNFNIIKELLLDENIEVLGMRNESITMTINDSNTINLDQTGYQKNLFGLFFNMKDEMSIIVYRQLMETFKDPKEGIKFFEMYLPQLEKGEPLDVYEEINGDFIFAIRSELDDLNVVYLINFAEINK